jgi:hypothetical protein
MADEQTGRELRDFFLELLQDVNLRQYYESPERRTEYVVSRRDNGLIGDEAQRLLLEGTLREIEENILLVTGSSRATPLWIVCPPM